MSPGGPEYLDSSAGAPIPPGAPGSGRSTGLIVAGVVAVVVLVGAAAWGAWSFFATGPQPAEALPDSTIAYLSVDLDPSGGQKLEALRTLQKFPGFKDHVGLKTDDDVRKRIFEEIQSSSTCEDLDYDDDVAPWLGDRMAVAAVDTGGDSPTPVVVLQVTDEDAADAGLAKLEDCGGGDSDSAAWSIDHGWALIGESQDTVDDIAAAAEKSPLSEDEEYTGWTDEAGDPGIATAYVAPEAGDLLADNLDDYLGPLDGLQEDMSSQVSYTGGYSATSDTSDELTNALKDFEGMAATVRFHDGALEIEVAADSGSTMSSLTGSDSGADVLETLPEDTAAAIGVGLADGWFGDLIDQLASISGDGTSADQLMSDLSEQSGLDLPDDAETLAGDSAALAIGSDFDPQTFVDSEDGSDVPIGLKVQGDPDQIDTVLDKVRSQIDDNVQVLDSVSAGNMIAIGPNDDYRAQLLEDGDLGDSEVFKNAVREADRAAAVLFVNFDANDWFSSLSEDDPELSDNLEPLQGLGLSTWLDGGTSHLLLRITTD